MKNSQCIMLAALLIAATEHVDASNVGGPKPTGKVTTTQKLNNWNNAKKAKQEAINEKTVAVERGEVLPTASLTRMQAARNLAHSAGTGIYNAGKAVYNAPGNISVRLGGQQQFITNPTSGSLRSVSNTFGRRFNEGFDMQMNPGKSRTGKNNGVEEQGLEMVPLKNGRAKNAEPQLHLERSLEGSENLRKVEQETQTLEAPRNSSANPSYANRAYNAASYAARAVYHTPGVLAYAAGAANPNIVRTTSANTMWAAGKIRDAAVTSSNAIYNAVNRPVSRVVAIPIPENNPATIISKDAAAHQTIPNVAPEAIPLEIFNSNTTRAERATHRAVHTTPIIRDTAVVNTKSVASIATEPVIEYNPAIADVVAKPIALEIFNPNVARAERATHWTMRTNRTASVNNQPRTSYWRALTNTRASVNNQQATIPMANVVIAA